MQTKETNNDDESRGQKRDADSGNEGSSNEILQKENLIDPGNEHHHPDNPDTGIPPRNDADSGSDATGTTGPEPGEAKDDDPDTSGEDG